MYCYLFLVTCLLYMIWLKFAVLLDRKCHLFVIIVSLQVNIPLRTVVPINLDVL